MNTGGHDYTEFDDSTAAAGECFSPTVARLGPYDHVTATSKTGTGYPSSSEYCLSYVC